MLGFRSVIIAGNVFPSVSWQSELAAATPFLGMLVRSWGAYATLAGEDPTVVCKSVPRRRTLEEALDPPVAATVRAAGCVTTPEACASVLLDIMALLVK